MHDSRDDVSPMEQRFNGVTSRADAVLLSKLFSHVRCPPRVRWVFELSQLRRNALGSVMAAVDGTGNTQSDRTVCVVWLVMRRRNDQHGTPLSHRQSGRADPAVMNNSSGAGEELRERDVIERDHILR